MLIPLKKEIKKKSYKLKILNFLVLCSAIYNVLEMSSLFIEFQMQFGFGKLLYLCRRFAHGSAERRVALWPTYHVCYLKEQY